MKRARSRSRIDSDNRLLSPIIEIKSDHPFWGYRRIWAYLSVCGFIWMHLDVFGCFWTYLSVFGLIWAYSGLMEPIYVQISACQAMVPIYV